MDNDRQSAKTLARNFKIAIPLIIALALIYVFVVSHG